MKILIAEDDYYLQDIYSTKFGIKGYQVEQAHTGREAIDALKRDDFDYVLLDLMMPVMSGEEVLAWMHNFKQVPTVIVTNKNYDKNLKGYPFVKEIIEKMLRPSEIERIVHE